jgi:hypothetical protein
MAVPWPLTTAALIALAVGDLVRGSASAPKSSGALKRERRPAAIGYKPKGTESQEQQTPGRGLGNCRTADLQLERWPAPSSIVGKEKEVRRPAAIIPCRDAWARVVTGDASIQARSVDIVLSGKIDVNPIERIGL